MPSDVICSNDGKTKIVNLMNRNKRFFNLARKLEIQRGRMKDLDVKIEQRKNSERQRLMSPFDSLIPTSDPA